MRLRTEEHQNTDTEDVPTMIALHGHGEVAEPLLSSAANALFHSKFDVMNVSNAELEMLLQVDGGGVRTETEGLCEGGREMKTVQKRKG